MASDEAVLGDVDGDAGGDSAGVGDGNGDGGDVIQTMWQVQYGGRWRENP